MTLSIQQSLAIGVACFCTDAMAVNNISLDALNYEIDQCYIETQKSQAASTAACNRVLRADIASRQNKAVALHNRGVIYLNQGNQDAAMINFSRALKRQPNMLETLVAKAKLLQKQRKHDQAKRLFVRAQKINAEHPLLKTYFTENLQARKANSAHHLQNYGGE